jgi:Mn2+/Fe2+ NRAMP family transporter
LLQVILLSQVANGILLPFVLTFMLLLVNRKALMGEYKNSAWANVVAGGTSVVMVALTVVLIWTSMTS